MLESTDTRRLVVTVASWLVPPLHFLAAGVLAKLTWRLLTTNPTGRLLVSIGFVATAATTAMALATFSRGIEVLRTRFGGLCRRDKLLLQYHDRLRELEGAGDQAGTSHQVE